MKPSRTSEPDINPMGRGYELHQSQQFRQPVEEITPPSLKFNVESCEDSPVDVGTVIHYKLSLHGFPINWTTRISDLSPNEYFVDEMIDGPYDVWEHIHTFEEIRGRTVMGDQVYYEMPYGWIGTVVNNLLVKRDLHRIFSYRAETLRSTFGPVTNQEQAKKD